MAYVATRSMRFRGTIYQKGDRVPAERSPNRAMLVAVGRLVVVRDDDVVEQPPVESHDEQQAPERTPSMTWTRAELDDYAGELGIDSPSDLQNKQDVLDAIEEKLTAPNDEGTD